MLWVPPRILEELEVIQQNLKVKRRCDGLDLLAHYSSVGRSLDFVTPVFGLPKIRRKR